jgi:hypothetical protein
VYVNAAKEVYVIKFHLYVIKFQEVHVIKFQEVHVLSKKLAAFFSRDALCWENHTYLGGEEDTKDTQNSRTKCKERQE